MALKHSCLVAALRMLAECNDTRRHLNVGRREIDPLKRLHPPTGTTLRMITWPSSSSPTASTTSAAW
jgi:hypothetical protein